MNVMLADEMAHGSQHQWLNLHHVNESKSFCQVLLLIALSEGQQEEMAVQIEASIVEKCKLLV